MSKPFLKYLEFRTNGGYNCHHSRNFYCRVWSRIKILVSSCKSYDHMSPLEGQVHHLDYMSYIYHACTGMKNRFPHPRSTILDWKRRIIKKGVRVRLIVKRKWRSSKVQWLDAHLLEQASWTTAMPSVINLWQLGALAFFEIIPTVSSIPV